MRHTAAAVLLVMGACGSGPDPAGEPADAPDPVVEKLRAGEAPATLRNDKNPAWLVEIGRALAEDRAWKSDADALAAVVHFAEHAGPDELPVIEGLLASDRSEIRMRGIFIARLSKLDATRDLLVRHAADLLNPGNVAVAKVALGAFSHRRAREATEEILSYFEATDDPAALRALGGIWAGGGDSPLRTAALVVAHALAMSPAASQDSMGAMLRMMDEKELDDFLAKWVPEKFDSREILVVAAGDKGFDRARGAKIHQAFLKSPDPAVVATILWRSPHKLDAGAVRPLLDDERVAAEGAKVCDYAAARLEAIDTGLPPELPADPSLRERRLKKWRAR